MPPASPQVLRHLLVFISLSVAFRQPYARAADQFPLVVSNGYAFVQSAALEEPLYVKKGNHIWEISSSWEPPRLVASLSKPGTISNCNMLFRDGHLFVAHDTGIFRIHPESGVVENYVDGVSVARLVGFCPDGTLLSLVTTMFGKASGSDAKSFVVAFSPDGVGRVVAKDVESTICSIAMERASGAMAIGCVDEVRLYSAGCYLRSDSVLSNVYCAKDLCVRDNRDLIFREESSAGEAVFGITSSGRELLGVPFSAIVAGTKLIVGLRDDSGALVYDQTDKGWMLVVSVRECDNEGDAPSYARQPVLSPSERYAFLSLACHEAPLSDGGRFTSSIRSMVLDLHDRVVLVMDRYYEQACWGEGKEGDGVTH